jgi:8-oxo-dGTP diphosphatase
MASDSRLYPSRPFLAVSVAIWRDGKALLVRRARPPLASIWSFPGGVVETGETLAEAAAREVREETGLEAEIVGPIDRAEVIRRDAEGKVERHYVIVVFAGRSLVGEPVAADDADAARWFEPGEIDGFELTPDTARIVRPGPPR